jgi:hypothetical protein
MNQNILPKTFSNAPMMMRMGMVVRAWAACRVSL